VLFGVRGDFIWPAAIPNQEICRERDTAGRNVNDVADIAKAIEVFFRRNGRRQLD
jgi:hypothetical protein